MYTEKSQNGDYVTVWIGIFFSGGRQQQVFSRRFIINPTACCSSITTPIHLMCVVSCADESFETECVACVCVVVVSLSLIPDSLTAS